MRENPKCPYCGGEMEYHWENNPMNPEGWFYCLKCHSQAPTAKAYGDAYAAAMKKMPECMPVVNWHKFDANDLDTYPQAYKSKLLFHRDGYVEEGEWIGAAEKWHQYHPNDVLKPDEVLYWCDLPKPPMEWMLENCCCFGEVSDE